MITLILELIVLALIIIIIGYYIAIAQKEWNKHNEEQKRINTMTKEEYAEYQRKKLREQYSLEYTVSEWIEKTQGRKVSPFDLTVNDVYGYFGSREGLTGDEWFYLNVDKMARLAAAERL